MNRKNAVRSLLGVLLIVASAVVSHAADRPNIILFMADDMGIGDTSAFQDFTGNGDEAQLHTPSMEKLARMGVRFTDAHTPSSRCTTTRYGLLTGRYCWRSRLKYWVLYGAQGDPLIEADRPTLATLLGDEGYRTAMVGKWHVGLRYRKSDGSPAAGWDDADLNQPLHTSPLDFGFDYARFTSRSHGTSGPDASAKKGQSKNRPEQTIGPGHIVGRAAIGATKNGKQLIADGPNAYVLKELGGRHSDHAIEFLTTHVAGRATNQQPFFLYYPANSNHSPYTPDKEINGQPVAGAARTKAGKPMDARHDFIYENDVALGRLLTWLETTADPRNPQSKLIENTLVIFTSDNGAEKNSNIATGPFRSNKGSCFEGGHRVPFIASWPAGKIGDGDATKPGQTSEAPIGLQDLYATFAEIVGAPLPDLSASEKGAEDSFSILPALHSEPLTNRPPLFFNDHKESRSDPAVLAMRLDSPVIDGKTYDGKWKLFFNAALVRTGKANPTKLYNLASDSQETTNLINEPELKPLVAFLVAKGLHHRNAGGHRLAELAGSDRVVFDWRFKSSEPSEFSQQYDDRPAAKFSVKAKDAKLTMTLSGVAEKGARELKFRPNFRGIGLSGGATQQVDGGEALLISFDRDVIVESAAIVAGNGQCGGFYQVGEAAPLAIYCVDADNDAKEQQGILSDLGILKAGAQLRLDSRPHFGAEPAGQWRLGAITVRLLNAATTDR